MLSEGANHRKSPLMISWHYFCGVSHILRRVNHPGTALLALFWDLQLIYPRDATLSPAAVKIHVVVSLVLCPDLHISHPGICALWSLTEYVPRVKKNPAPRAN